MDCLEPAFKLDLTITRLLLPKRDNELFGDKFVLEYSLILMSSPVFRVFLERFLEELFSVYILILLN